MSTVTVVTAFNPRNAGMYSVDLAAEQFLQRHGYSTRLIRTQAKRTWLKPRFGRQHFELIRNSKLLFETDILVYWGDFTTNLLYGLNDFARRDLAFGYNKTQTAAFESWAQLFLPERANKSTAVYSIGQNFHSVEKSLKSLSEDAREKIEERYRSSFDAILPRDDISFQSLNNLNLGKSGVKISQGLDPALLIDHYALYPELRRVKQSATFAYVFGRSDFLQIPELLHELEHRSGLKGINLPSWHDLDSFAADRKMRRMLETIAGAKFVLTDTYHCAINAMGIGKPVFCMGLNQATQSSTVGEPKKGILFQMMGLMENYFEFDDQFLSNSDREIIISTIINRIDDLSPDMMNISDLKVKFHDAVATTLQSGMVK
jgi:hypothetical protein